MVLAEKLGATLRTVDISASVRSHFKDIGHDMEDHSVTYENAQARERTQVLMDIANQNGGIVIGTGDLSELALGWCTYNGDHMSMYAVNCSIPKTLVRHLVAYLARDNAEKDEALRDVLEDILDTPVSPELLPAVQGRSASGRRTWWAPMSFTTSSCTMLRWGFSPRKIYRLAVYALGKAVQPGGDFEVAQDLLPPLLLPAVQAQLPAGRPQGGHRGPVPPRRLADAQRREGGSVAGRAGDAGVEKNTSPPPVAIFAGPPGRGESPRWGEGARDRRRFPRSGKQRHADFVTTRREPRDAKRRLWQAELDTLE
ncbi:MAG: hypothetical protein V8R40_12825 [Dysosmobacter sp.]